MSRRFAVIATLAAAGFLVLPATAQAPTSFQSAEEAREALDAARQQQRNARARGERLEAQALRKMRRHLEEKVGQEPAALAAAF